MIKCAMCGISKPEEEIKPLPGGGPSSVCNSCDVSLPKTEVVNQRCGKCGEEKSLDNFVKDKKRKSGRFPYCKKCQKELYLKRKRLDNVKGNIVGN